MGLFKKKESKSELKKLVMSLNKKMFIEYRCPYCNHLIYEQYYADKNEPKIEIEFCPNCSKEFIK